MIPAGSTVVPCPYAREETSTHWLEFELVGENDQPVPWEEYMVVLPDGSITSGYLDENGATRLQNIEQTGICRICFPNLDEAAWEEVQLVAAK